MVAIDAGDIWDMIPDPLRDVRSEFGCDFEIQIIRATAPDREFATGKRVLRDKVASRWDRKALPSEQGAQVRKAGPHSHIATDSNRYSPRTIPDQPCEWFEDQCRKPPCVNRNADHQQVPLNLA
jgi:hypothetical protein